MNPTSERRMRNATILFRQIDMGWTVTVEVGRRLRADECDELRDFFNVPGNVDVEWVAQIPESIDEKEGT